MLHNQNQLIIDKINQALIHYSNERPSVMAQSSQIKFGLLNGA